MYTHCQFIVKICENFYEEEKKAIRRHVVSQFVAIPPPDGECGNSSLLAGSSC